jgi:hypothetical protein
MLSTSKIGQGAATLAAVYVAYNVTKPATRWVFNTYNNYMHKPDASTTPSALSAPKPIKLGYYQDIALKIIPAAAALVAGAVTYRNIGWIASGLAARVSTMFGSSETAKKVEVAVTGNNTATIGQTGVTAANHQTVVGQEPVDLTETPDDLYALLYMEETD